MSVGRALVDMDGYGKFKTYFSTNVYGYCGIFKGQHYLLIHDYDEEICANKSHRVDLD